MNRKRVDTFKMPVMVDIVDSPTSPQRNMHCILKWVYNNIINSCVKPIEKFPFPLAVSECAVVRRLPPLLTKVVELCDGSRVTTRAANDPSVFTITSTYRV